MKKHPPPRIRNYNEAIEGLKHRIRLAGPKRKTVKELQHHMVNVRLRQLKSEIRRERREKEPAS